MSISDLVNRLHADEGSVRFDTRIAEGALASIRNEFEASRDPFDRHRAICAQIGAADSPDLRRMLMRLRDEFEAQMVSAAIGEIHEAFDRSPEDGWKAWLTALAAAVPLGYLRYSLRLCHHTFPFDPSREQAVVDIRRALQCLRQSRWEEAYEEVESLSKREFLPPLSRARLVTLLGQVDLLRFEKPERALRLFEEAERMAPDDGLVLDSLGSYWLLKKTLEAARAYFERAMKQAPRMASGYVGMGDALEQDESLEETARLTQAEAWYREAISQAGGDSLAYQRLLQLLGRPENLKNREREFLAVVETKVAVDPDGEYDTYLDVGQYYLTSKRFPEASGWYEKAISLEKQWPRAYVDLAECCRVQGKVKDAEDLCNKAIELAHDYPRAYLSLATIYEEQSRWREALALYERFPRRPRQWASLARASAGRMHAELGEYEKAERILFDELRAGVEEAHARHALEGIAADYYQKRGDRKSAERLYGEILRILGDDQYCASYHNWLGNLHYFFDEYEAAVREYKLAIDAAPGEAVYHRNGSGAYELLKDYENAERELDLAYKIDRDEKLLRRNRARLANAQGNDVYNKGEYGKAIEEYTKAVELEPSQAVYHANLALAWEQLKEPGNREHALEQAIRCYEGAQKIIPRQDRTERIGRLRRRIEIARAYGEKALDYINVMTPIAVEVAANLIPSIKGATPGTLSQELLSNVNAMRESVLKQFGVRIPGIRFRGNETDLPDGTYIVMINEIPLVSGNLSPDRGFCPAPRELLSRLDVKGAAGSDPVSGRDGLWIDQKDWKKVESQNFELWRITRYLMRHVEAVVRKNLVEFLGHQEIVGLLESESARLFEEIRASSPMITALTTVCRALVAEEVPIHPFKDLCATFKDLSTKGMGLRDIVEHIRSLPTFRDRLPGNDGQHSFLRLSPRFETEIRRALYERDGHVILAVEPERCQEALAAVRSQVDGRSLALMVDDAALRPFMRKLVELEFPNLPVLSRAESPADVESVSARSIDLDGEPAAEPLDFSDPRRADVNAGSPERGQSRALSQMDVTVFTSEDFETNPSTAADQPIGDMCSTMQDGLFYELGIVLPQVKLGTDSSLKSGAFRIRLNGVERAPVPGLGHDEFLVNDTVERLALLDMKGRKAVNPANGSDCAIVRDTKGEVEICRRAGLTTWGPRGYLVLNLSSEIRRAAARFQTDDVTQYCLDSLGEAFPDLVRIGLERYRLPEISQLLRDLLDEDISIRDLRNILESLLSVNGTTDVDLNRFIVFPPYTDGLCPAIAARNASNLTASQLADYVRTSLRRSISHKYTRGGNTLVVHLMDPAIEQRIRDVGARPLTEQEGEKLRAAISREVGNLPPTAPSPVLLTSFEIRRALRRIVEQEFPRLAVLSYQELSPDLNIQPIARISWD